MLGFVCAQERGSGDRLLADVARDLTARGMALAGVVQVNTEVDPDRPCLMELRLLPGGSLIRISQDLGAFASGCRLDSSQLETAVGRVEAALQNVRPDLLILNKFGKAEAEGRGFRPLIGAAMAIGVPVLLQVSVKNQGAFDDFAQDLAIALPHDVAAVAQWCLSVTRV